MSDSHAVCSADVSPDLPAPDPSLNPMFAPSTVNLPDPVDPTLPRLTTLPPQPSNVSSWLPLPPRIPTVTDTRPLPVVAPPVWHTTDVSDAHTLPSQPDPPTPPRPDASTRPSPAPDTVTLADPVPAPFARLTELTSTPSDENTPLLLPALPAAVTTARRLPIAPCPARHKMHVLDCHPDSSHTLPPTRPPPVTPDTPSPAPNKDTTTDPVAALFFAASPLAAPVSTDPAPVSVPVRTPTLATVLRLLIWPWLARHRNPVSASHHVPAQLVP